MNIKCTPAGSNVFVEWFVKPYIKICNDQNRKKIIWVGGGINGWLAKLLI